MKYSAKVSKLLDYAVFDFSEDWSNYLALEFTEEDVPALLQLALDEEAIQNEDELVSSAPYHAWRVLGLLKLRRLCCHYLLQLVMMTGVQKRFLPF